MSFFTKNKVLLGSFIFLSLYCGALYTFATTYVSPGTILDPVGIPGSYTVTPPLTYGGAVTSGHDGEVAYIDASGNLASDDLFTRDSGDTKQTDIFSNTYAQASTNDGVSNQVTFQADTIGTAGNSISLVFNGVDDAQTVMDAWNIANPSNTISIVNGVGTTVPTSGTVTLIGGGTTGFSSGNLNNFLGDLQGSGMKLEDTTNNLTTFSLIGNLSSTVASSSLGNIFGSVNANTGALSVGIFQSNNFQLMSTDQSTYTNLIQADDTQIYFQSNNIGFRADTGGFVGWYDNGASTEFAFPTSLPASTSYVLGVSALTANTATLDWVLSGGGLTGYTDTDNTALGVSTGATGLGTQNTFLGNKAGGSLFAGDGNTFIGYQAGGSGAPVPMNNSVIVGLQNTGYAWAGSEDFVAIGNNTIGGAGITSGSVVIGSDANSTGLYGIAIGQNANVSADYGIAIGGGASTIGHSSSIALGELAINTASNQMVIGSGTNPITDYYFGSGVTHTSLPNNMAIHATGGSGTDKAGGQFAFYAGQSTGTGVGGDLRFYVSPAVGMSGSSDNPFHNFLQLGANKISKFGDVDDAYYGLLLDIDNNAGGINLGNMGGAGGNSTHISINDGAQSIIFSYGADSYTFPIGSGNLGQVLQTDGAGQLSWVSNTPYSLYKEHIASPSGNTVSGNNAVAIGDDNTVTGQNSVSIGLHNQLFDEENYALGYNNVINVSSSVALGQGNTIDASNAIALGGSNNIASGVGSAVAGVSNRAYSTLEMAIGINATPYTPQGTGYNQWHSEDRLFVIGNGAVLGNSIYAAAVNDTPSDAFTVLKDGTVGINIDNFETNTNGNPLQVGDGGTSIIGYVDGGTGNWVAVSDARTKTNVSDISYGLAQLTQLRPVSYDFIRNGEHAIGFIAQEVKPIIPEVVFGDEKQYGIAYQALVPVTIKAIQELDLKIKPLEDLMTSENTFAEILRIWFESTTNGIRKIFVQEVHTDQICVKKSNGGETCVTGDQLDILLSGGNGGAPNSGGTTTGGDNSSSGTSSDGTGDTTTGGTDTPPPTE